MLDCPSRNRSNLILFMILQRVSDLECVANEVKRRFFFQFSVTVLNGLATVDSTFSHFFLVYTDGSYVIRAMFARTQ